ASCIGCSFPSGARPSMVTIFLPATLPTRVTHDRVGAPSISTVQAAHWPSPHPYFVPVRSKSSRSTLRRVRSESASIRRFEPLTSSSVILGIGSFSRETRPAADRHPDRAIAAQNRRRELHRIAENRSLDQFVPAHFGRGSTLRRPSGLTRAGRIGGP